VGPEKVAGLVIEKMDKSLERVSDRQEKAMYKLILHTLCPFIQSTIQAEFNKKPEQELKAKQKKERCIKEVKRVLWAYRELRKYIHNEGLYLEDFGTKPEKSKDIRSGTSSSGVKLSRTEIEAEYLENARENYERTLLQLQTIERALDRVADSDDFLILECRYLNDTRYTKLETSIELNISESSVSRGERRILEDLILHMPSLSDLDLGV
jgi:DNA-directed RNA polymerase specialized sigma subunit